VSSPLPPGVRELMAARARTGAGTVRLLRLRDEEWREVYPGDAVAGLQPPDGAVRQELPPEVSSDGWAVEVAGPDAHREADYLAVVVGRALLYEREAHSAARELTERYEEINLLYFISEILGSVLSVPDAASRILVEVSDVLSARRASLWVYRPEERVLDLAAAVGEEGLRGPISVDDPESATAWVFRQRESLNLERGTVLADLPRLEPRPQGREAFLSVPINYTPPDGEARNVGVITLVGRRSNVRFSAGDARLLAAIASQVGAALETQRLVQESLRQERLVRELELAHDLQLKLLPDPSSFHPPPEVAARCTPADTVGGDFYQLFRLPGDRLGIMIGDVSSHGFSAALIMALTMSALGIYAQESGPPGEVLKSVHRALMDELESTEMYMTLFYAVLDPTAGRMVYANAGHPHVFRLSGDGATERLGATDPPMGMLPLDNYGEAHTSWEAGDILCLFTDGLSDALAHPGSAGSGERALVERVRSRFHEPLEDVLAALFDAAAAAELHTPADDRTALLVRR